MLFEWQPFLSLAAAAAVGAVAAVPMVIYLVPRLWWIVANFRPLLRKGFLALPWLWFGLSPALLVCASASPAARPVTAVLLIEAFLLFAVQILVIRHHCPDHWRRNSALAFCLLLVLWLACRAGGTAACLGGALGSSALLLGWMLVHVWRGHRQASGQSFWPRPKFRLRALLIAMGIFCLYYAWPYLHRDYAFLRLGKYNGVFIPWLPYDEREQINAWVKTAINQADDDPHVARRECWSFCREHVPGVGGRTYTAFLAYRENIPGDYWQVSVADVRGRVLSTRNLYPNTSTRPHFSSIISSAYGVHYVIVEPSRTKFPEGPERDYYLLLDSDVEFLRSERFDGRMAGDLEHAFAHYVRHPAWDHWKGLLASDNPVNQLRGLAAILSGDVKKWLAQIDEPTRRCLVRLCESPDPWIREEAQAALKMWEQTRE